MTTDTQVDISNLIMMTSWITYIPSQLSKPTWINFKGLNRVCTNYKNDRESEVYSCHSENTKVYFLAQHYTDIIMSAMAYQITGVMIVYSTICSGADQRKHQRSSSQAFVRGIHRWPVNSPHKDPVTRKMFPFDDVLMRNYDEVSVYTFHTILRKSLM